MLFANAIEMCIKFYLLHCVFAWIHHTEFDLIQSEPHANEKWFASDDHKIYLSKGRVENTSGSKVGLKTSSRLKNPTPF